MTCESVRRLVSQFSEEELSWENRQAVLSHLPECPECHLHAKDLKYVQSALRQLPKLEVPKSLTSKLRVAASYDRERRQGAGEFSSPWQRYLTRIRLIIHDLMRPLAVPAAGGLLSSVLMFTTLVDTFAVRMPAQDDSPLGDYTQATVDTVSPFGFTGSEMTVELSIDKYGRVDGISTNHVKLTREEMNHLGRLVLFTKFNPARSDGQPVSGKIILKSFGINVHG